MNQSWFILCVRVDLKLEAAALFIKNLGKFRLNIMSYPKDDWYGREDIHEILDEKRDGYGLHAASYETAELGCMVHRQLDVMDALLFDRINKELPFQDWKEAVYGRFCANFMEGIVSRNIYKGEEAIDLAMERLEHFEQAARIHVLFMIAWKALCQIEIPLECKRSAFTFFSWTSEGWKKSPVTKQAMLKSNDLHIILESVLPFVLEKDELPMLAKLSSKNQTHKTLTKTVKKEDNKKADNSNKRKRTD